ncbi:unnamed protein product [Candida verbasci]|uniref:Replication protein A subunit n=1 Tax=Candida verbasci TaxID=1227364 RepID=A0A9W4TTG4_9ASCO|nr:unnamed protein product [Candida verbasci]
MSFQLSTGVIKNIFSKDTHDKHKPPFIFQITNIKPFQVQNQTNKKYRILLSDGKYMTQGLIDEACSTYLENNNCNRYAIVQVNDYSIFRTLKHFFVIKDLEILKPTGEKSTTELIQIDQYFQQHPEEEYLESTSKEKEKSPAINNKESTPVPLGQSLTKTSSPAPAPAPQQQFKPTASAAPSRITPIETLSPYQNNWTIKARVSYKGDLRTWSNQKGEGKVFGVNFLDESDEIKASAFNETAERAYKLLEEGKVYYISKARVSQARKKFNNLTHPYELQLDKDTEINECFDETDVPKLNFNFVKLDQIQNLDQNSIVDVLGALKVVNPPFQITAKSTGKAFDRRDITIVDETGFAIDVGLWNQTAVDFNIEEGTVVAFKGCKVSDFSGRSLSLTQAGSLIPNPGTPESFQLKGWYDNIGISENYKTLKSENMGGGGIDKLASRKFIAQALDEPLGEGDKADYFTVKASLSFAKPDNFAYPACTNVIQISNDSSRPPTQCNKKLIEQTNDGTWRCERCEKNYDQPTWRYIINCSIVDSTGQMWVTLFDEQAKKLFGIEANEMKEKKEESNDAVGLIIQGVTYKEYNFRLKAKQDTFNEELRTRYQCMAINELDYLQENEYLCKELDSLLV